MRYGLLLVALLIAAVGCNVPGRDNLPPSQMIMHPGPGVDGPGPGVMVYSPPPPTMLPSSQVYFVGPESMEVVWDVTAPGAFDSPPLVVPARYNFPQNAVYRLKLSKIPGYAGVELYPSLEIGPSLPRTVAFLAHNTIPVQLTNEDIDQVLSGNFVTKVIYLPDPQYQELALAGVETLVSTRLEPGVDPITEADRRGAILAIVRLGNKDLQLPGDAAAAAGMQGMPPGMAGLPTAADGVNPAAYVAGVTVPQYGMPMCGTPIGLPGPPHVPLGVPAGLQRHSITNHTYTHIPEPTRHVSVDVRQDPGFCYPQPANHVYIAEQQIPPHLRFRQPPDVRRQVVAPEAGVQGVVADPGVPCPPQAGAQP
jgi:hypothetical protein